MKIKYCTSDEEIICAFPAMQALRPSLDPLTFVSLIKEMQSEGYQLVRLQVEDKVVAVMGFRYLQFLTHGKHFYIDDLSTLPEERGKGYGKELLRWIYKLAKDKAYGVITLDSGHHRYDAHRLYLKEGFQIRSHHFVKEI